MLDHSGMTSCDTTVSTVHSSESDILLCGLEVLLLIPSFISPSLFFFPSNLSTATYKIPILIFHDFFFLGNLSVFVFCGFFLFIFFLDGFAHDYFWHSA